MSRLAVILMVLVVSAVTGRARAQNDTPSPHNSTDPEMCTVCHNADMSLSRSKVETCTLCHAATVHGGSNEHLEATAASVAQAVSGTSDAKAKLPLTEDGRIWCGTCHLYHNPTVLGPPWLTQGWVPPSSGLAAAVRSGVEARSDQLSRDAGSPTPGITFATKGTRALRLPVADASLCRSCHGSLP